MNAKRKRGRKRREVLPHRALAPPPLHHLAVAAALLAHHRQRHRQRMKRRLGLAEIAIESHRAKLEGWELMQNREVPNAVLEEYPH